MRSISSVVRSTQKPLEATRFESCCLIKATFFKLGRTVDTIISPYSTFCCAREGALLIVKEVIERSKGLPISVELFISEERYNEIKEKFGVPKIGDILITAVGTIGKIWAIDTDNKFYFKDGNLVWLKDIDNQLANSCFFRRLLEYLIEEYKKTNANGAAYNALTIAKLKLMSCPLPPLSLQRLFAQRIEQIEREKSEVQKSIQDLETLLASRMQYWFE